MMAWPLNSLPVCTLLVIRLGSNCAPKTRIRPYTEPNPSSTISPLAQLRLASK
jgi:hypothetical protein